MVKYGPVSVGLSAGAPGLHYYKKGIFNNCGAVLQVNHAVVLVGWGEITKKSQKVKYWHIKTSWGASWGDKEYLRLLRSKGMEDEPCGWDHEPQKGSECDLAKGGRPKMRACGYCAVISASSYPLDVHWQG